MNSIRLQLCDSAHFDITRIRELRHKILRAPWHVPPEHEWDPCDLPTYTGRIMNAYLSIGTTIVATGRIHQTAPGIAQVRYMAIDDLHQRQGFGRRVLEALEQTARAWQIEKIFLNARDKAIPFYLSQGYHDVAPADTIFGTVIHRRMEKVLDS